MCSGDVLQSLKVVHQMVRSTWEAEAEANLYMRPYLKKPGPILHITNDTLRQTTNRPGNVWAGRTIAKDYVACVLHRGT